MSKPVTLKTISKYTGVSYQTVSKILRNEGQVSAEVRQRVLTAIEELGYRPNAAAQMLRTQTSHLIGYSWATSRKGYPNFVLDQFQHSIVECAEELGYHILLVPQMPNQPVQTHFQELLTTRRVDGFILSSIEYNDPRVEAVQQLKAPYATFGQLEDRYPGSYVEVDNRVGVGQLMDHLINQGHRQIAILAWPEQSRTGNERLAGYLDAMAAHQLPINPEWLIRGTGEIDYGYKATQKLLALRETERPSAIVTMLDTIALGAMQAVEAKGLRVGTDIAITGFDDLLVSQFLTPRLTTIRQPIWEVGKTVISLLVAQLRGEPLAATQIMLAPEVIIRESSLGFGRVHPEKGASEAAVSA